MFIYLFSRLILNPRLALTELRSSSGGYAAMVSAFLAVATSTLAHSLIYRSGSGVLSWIIASLLHFVALLAVAIFYLPVIHLFAEKSMPASRVSDLFVYAGFILSPLFLSLPFAFIFLLVPLGWLFYTLVILALWAVIYFDFIEGVRINYQLPAAAAVLCAIAPLLLAVFIPAVLALLAFLLYV